MAEHRLAADEAIYVHVADLPVVRTEELANPARGGVLVNVDLAADGTVVGVEVVT